MSREVEMIEVACMPKGHPKYKVAYSPGAMHRLLCEEGVLYAYISPSNELIMMRENELCPSCGGTGVCSSCKGNGKVLCTTCNGTGKVKLFGVIPRSCSKCGGTGLVLCTSCNGRGVCPDCMGRRHRTSRTIPKIKA